MDKVFCIGWIYDKKTKEYESGLVETKFLLKTKKIVGMKDKEKTEYYYIPCEVRGKKAINVRDNITDGTRACFWARIILDDIGRLTLAVDDIEFL
ncbi:hypothetical protein [Clostridium sp.]|uniref:hypothetical protein n=1 Tax=Clostridium sp. TaxID=1506 RepID=UPI0025B8C998|nr:hypothetical protein [Clostridium sp.]